MPYNDAGMRWSPGLVATAVLASGCLDGRYVCTTSSQCSLDGVAGTCEPIGFCSFPDPACAPSGRRYGEHADASHRDRCVVDDGGCIRSLASGGAHSCVVAGDATIWCWGANDAGQLGSGGFASSAVPVQVIDEMGRPFTDAVDVDAGFDFTCARRVDRSLWCWGNGRRLGAGVAGPEPHPQRVVKAEGVTLAAVHVAAGSTHACAVSDDSSVWCWGANDETQLGDGSMVGEQLVAAPVRWADSARFDGALRVAAGSQFSCATRADNMWCWGNNRFVQLGLPGGPDSSPSPVVTLSSSVTALSAGGGHGCAIDADRIAWCWGRAEDGQIGEPGLPGVGVAPVRVRSAPSSGPLTDVVSIATGEAHSCAATADGRARCWGAGDMGQLGQPVVRAETPVEVQLATGEPLGDIVAVTAGIDDYRGAAGRFSCARQRDAVWCWGIGDHGALGNGDNASSAVAVGVDLSNVCR